MNVGCATYVTPQGETKPVKNARARLVSGSTGTGEGRAGSITFEYNAYRREHFIKNDSRRAGTSLFNGSIFDLKKCNERRRRKGKNGQP